MTKHCQCGKTKTIQPYNAAGSMKFTCDDCKRKQERWACAVTDDEHSLDKIFLR